ncbi:MAG TPA: hypothetical protein VNI02_05955, partial [Blastocatellia bacterium]|nr:hypothetical protein [Blastocatellia bacterium]
MKLLENTYIQNITQKPTIFICGDKEKLKTDILELLIELKANRRLECLYFIRPTNDLKDYLKTVLSEGEDYQIIDLISEVSNFNSKNVIACGIEFPFSDDFEFLKKSNKNQILIFFKEMGIFKGGLEQKHKNIIFVEQTFRDFAENYIQTGINPEPIIDTSRKTTFENRGRQKDEHINFMSSQQRVAKIVGLVGFGKKSFMDEIKIRFPNRNYFQFVFTDKTN